MTLTFPAVVGATLLAVALSLLLAVWFRRQIPAWGLLPVAVLLAAFPAFCSKNLRYVDVHGFMHASYAYALMNRGLPPEDVLLAGYPLRYPWAQHYLTGIACRLLGANPPDLFLATNLLALVGTLCFVYRASYLLLPERRTATLAALLSLTGTSIFHAGPLQTLVNHLPKIRVDERVVPFHKFMLSNGNPLGILCFSAFLYLILLLTQGRSTTKRLTALLSLVTAAAAYLYPIAWMAQVVASLPVCLICWRSGFPERRRAAGLLVALAAGTLLALPYLVEISSHKAASAAITLRLRPGYLGWNFTSLFCALAVPAALLAFQGKTFNSIWQRQRSTLTALGAIAGGLGVLYCAISIPTESHYKILALLCMAVGLIAAPLLVAFWDRTPVGGVIVTTLLLLPATSFEANLLQTWRVETPIHARGINLHADRSDEDAIYQWLRDHTRPDAVVVDTELVVPALGQRSLYVALDPDPHSQHLRDGWAMRPTVILAEVVGENPEIVARRRQQVSRLYHSTTAPDQPLRSISGECGGRELLIIARTPVEVERLAACQSLEFCQRTPVAALFRSRLPMRPTL